MAVRYPTTCNTSPQSNDLPSWLVLPFIGLHTLTEFNLSSPPLGKSYRGPNAGADTLCVCNTVVYSLVSACGACQGDSWIEYALCQSTRKF